MLRKTLFHGCIGEELRYYFYISISKANMINFQKNTQLPILLYLHAWITCVKITTTCRSGFRTVCLILDNQQRQRTDRHQPAY